MPKSKKYDMVRVTWIDAEEYGEVGWNSLPAQLKYAKSPLIPVESVGFEVYRDKKHIALLSSIGGKECSTLEKIPIAFVKSIDKLLVDKRTK